MDYYKKRLIKRAFNRHIYKFLFMLLVFFICLFLYGTFHLVFGYYEFEANGNNYQVPDLPSHDDMPYYFIYDGDYIYDQDINGEEFPLVVIFSNSPLPIIRSSTYYNIYINNTSAVSYYNVVTNQWVHIEDYLDDHTYRVGLFNRSYNSNFSWDDIGQYVILNSNYDIYEYGTHTIIHESDVITLPYILTDTTTISNWTLNEFSFTTGDIEKHHWDEIKFEYGDKTFWLELNDFSIDNGNIYTIPIEYINAYIVFYPQDTFKATYYHFDGTVLVPYNLGSFTVSITADYAQELNDNSDRTLQNEQLWEQRETNNQLNQLNNSITDTNFNDNDISFPSIDVDDGGVLNAMASFFDKIYDAFVNGTLYDIVIPIPYTNKNIVIPYNYTETQLTNANATWIITIIQLGWWYILGKFIIINLFEKVITIMRGSVEKVQMQSVTTKLL